MVSDSCWKQQSDSRPVLLHWHDYIDQAVDVVAQAYFYVIGGGEGGQEPTMFFFQQGIPTPEKKTTFITEQGPCFIYWPSVLKPLAMAWIFPYGNGVTVPKWPPGGRLNKKDGLTRCGDSHVKDKTS